MNYLIVLFKNKSKKKIINKFILYDKAKDFFDKLIVDSEKVIFEKKVENGDEVKYEIGMVQKNPIFKGKIYFRDEFGRNIKVEMKDEDMGMLFLNVYKVEEKIFDVSAKNKITSSIFLKKYMLGGGLKVMSVLNNKVVLQTEDRFNLFSLKSESESERFIECFRQYYLNNSYSDCIFVIDRTNAYKKEMYKLLENAGYKKGFLYRKFTSF